MSGSELNGLRWSILMDLDKEVSELQRAIEHQSENYERFSITRDFSDEYAAEVEAKAARIKEKLAKARSKIKVLFD